MRSPSIEEKLSDALHERLAQRFVDRRTAVLMHDLGRKGAGEFPVHRRREGEVSVGSYPIGRLQGFAFEVDPTARHADRKMLLATAERRLGGEYEKRAAALVAEATIISPCAPRPGQPVAILWRGHEVARLGPGKNLLSPRVLLDRRIDRVSERGREAVVERLDDWVRHQVERALGAAARGRGGRSGSGGAGARSARSWRCWSTKAASSPARRWPRPLAALDREQRRAVTRLGVRIGALDLFMPDVLKPEAMRWRTALRAAAAGEPMPALPPQSAVVLPTPADGERALLARLGFRAARAADAAGRPGRAARPPRPRGPRRQARGRWSTRRWRPRSACSRRRWRG